MEIVPVQVFPVLARRVRERVESHEEELHSMAHKDIPRGSTRP